MRLAATPGRPGLFLGQPLGSPETLCQGRPVGGLVHVRVFYLILPDQMFQEPFPVHKDSIKLDENEVLHLQAQAHEERAGGSGGRSSVPGK